MNRKGYTVLGWAVWQVGSRLAKRRITANRLKIGVAGATGATVLGLITAKSVAGDD
jgi:hypothetical protein